MTHAEHRDERAERLDETEVEAHREDLDRPGVAPTDAGETEEREVEAHRFENVEPPHDS